MNKLKTFLKGKLEKLSLQTIIAGLLTAKTDVIPAFTEASNIDINLVSIAGIIGAIWGILRRSTKAYKAK